MEITFERDFEKQVIVRNTYNLFDLFAEMGGILCFSIFFASKFLNLWNYNDLDNYLVTKLYRVKQPEIHNESQLEYQDRSASIRPGICQSL